MRGVSWVRSRHCWCVLGALEALSWVRPMPAAGGDSCRRPGRRHSVSTCRLIVSSSGMLPNAVLPPSLDHNYAQWQEREESSHTEQPPLMKKIIPAPKPKGPGEPDSPTPLHPPTPPILSKSSKQSLRT